jgi:hypothetical protein
MFSNELRLLLIASFSAIHVYYTVFPVYYPFLNLEMVKFCFKAILPCDFKHTFSFFKK